jgi:ribosome-associated protein
MPKAERRLKTSPMPRVPKAIKVAIAAAADKKAEQALLLDLRKSSAFTDFFLIVNGTNIRQVQAIADAIEEALRDIDVKPSLIEGYERGQWVLIDYFDFVVHIFLPSTREFYALERLWGDAKRVEL